MTKTQEALKEMPTDAFLGTSVWSEAVHRYFIKHRGTIRSALKAQEWQPISSAPKDGTEILTYEKSKWGEDNMEVVKWCEDGWDGPKFYHADDEEYGPDNPSHWQHLPTPPEAK